MVLSKENAAMVYLTAVIMSYLRDGGINELGRRASEYVKYLVDEEGLDQDELEDFLQTTLESACKALPGYIKSRTKRKRSKTK